MTSSSTRTAHLMALLADAEAVLADARREEARTAKVAARAADRVTAARADLTQARKELRAAERTGQGVKAKARTVAARTAKLEKLLEAARETKATAAAARRTAAAAARRLDATARRAARSAACTVERIAARLGSTALAPTANEDRTLDVDQLPAVEEIEAKAAEFADYDRRAKDAAKQAEALKTWLRALPVGAYGRVVITRAPGRSVLDQAQICLDYAARGAMPPRKATKTTFKVDTAALADAAAEAVINAAAAFLLGDNAPAAA